MTTHRPTHVRGRPPACFFRSGKRRAKRGVCTDVVVYSNHDAAARPWTISSLAMRCVVRSMRPRSVSMLPAHVLSWPFGSCTGRKSTTPVGRSIRP